MSNVKPVRLQLSRKKGFRLTSPNGLPIVVVSRPGKWGNPFRQPRRAHAADPHMSAVEAFRVYVWYEANWPYRLEAQQVLRGKDLACWCSLDKPCHADVLLEIANAGGWKHD